MFGLRQSQACHITSDLEVHIQRELLELDGRLRSDALDNRPFLANMLHARAEALRWVLKASATDL